MSKIKLDSNKCLVNIQTSIKSLNDRIAGLEATQKRILQLLMDHKEDLINDEANKEADKFKEVDI